MTLTCPVCGTCYRVERQDLGGPAGRTVRCANCGHTWHHASPDEKLLDEKPQTGQAAEAAAPPRGEPRLGNPPEPLWGPSFEGALGRRARLAPSAGRRPSALIWVAPIVLVVLLGLAVLLGIIARGRVAAIWPSAARLYAWIGHPVEASGAGSGDRQDRADAHRRWADHRRRNRQSRQHRARSAAVAAGAAGFPPARRSSSRSSIRPKRCSSQAKSRISRHLSRPRSTPRPASL